MQTHKRHEPSGKIWIEHQGKPILGKGGAEILKEIDAEQSLSKAARKLGMSYRYVWGYVQKIQNTIGENVVETYKGGKTGGGGAKLTKVGRNLLEEYMQLEGYLSESLARSKSEEQNGPNLNARNQLKGIIVALRKGATTAEVTLETKAPTVITAVITRDAAKDLGLKVGDEVRATIKSIEIIARR